MPEATSAITTLPLLSPIAVAAGAARTAEADYRAALALIPDTPDHPAQADASPLDAAADRRRGACRALAGMSATWWTDFQAIAAVLIDTAVHSRDQPPVIHDNEGLVWSLLNDILATPRPA